MTPTQLAAATLIVIAGIGIVVAVLVGPLLRRRGTMDPRVVRARAMSYAALAGILAIAILIGLPALTVMFAAIAAVALLEWSRLADLPVHHVIALRSGASRSWSRRPCTARGQPTCSSVVSCWPVP